MKINGDVQIKHNEQVWLVLICFAGLMLRLFYLDHQSLWFDEIATLINSKQKSFIEVIQSAIIIERSPPFYHVFMHYWVNLFGHSAFSLRLPSVVSGTITLFFTYKISRLLFHKNIALLSTSLLSISPFHIYYSQEARFFSFSVLFGCVSFYFFLKFLDKHKTSTIVYYLIASSLSLWVSYVGILILMAQNIIFFLSKDVQSKKQTWLFVQTLLILACILPSFFFLRTQITQGYTNEPAHNVLTGLESQESEFSEKEAQQNPAKTDNSLFFQIHKAINFKTSQGLRYLFIHLPAKFGSGMPAVNRSPYQWSNEFTSFFIYPSIAFFLIFLLLSLRLWKDPGVQICLIVVIISIGGTFTISLLDLRPIGPRHAVQALPFFVILICASLYNLKHSVVKALCGLILMITMTVSLYLYYFDSRTYKDDWPGVVAWIMKKIEPQDLLLFHGEFPYAPFRYYVLSNKKHRDKWKTLNLPFYVVRGRDGSLEDFFINTFPNKKKDGINRIYLIDYYADIKEKKLLDQKLSEQYIQVLHSNDFGKKLSLKEYSAIQ